MTAKKSPKKTDALTLRLDPRTKFLIEMSSRLGHQSITGVIESAVKLQAQHRKVSLCGEESTLGMATELLWAPEESERLVNMMLYAPGLLSHEELCIKTVMNASEFIFFNMHPVTSESFEYRQAFYFDRKGAFYRGENGNLWFVTPRLGLIKLAWIFLKLRGEELAEKGTFKPFTVEELELLLGRSLESISPRIKIPKGDLEEDERISVTGQDKEMDDLVGNVTGKH